MYTAEQIKWAKINFEIGKRLGYPICCIMQFCIQSPEYLSQHKPTKNDVIRCEVSTGFGFIPCAFHANEIKAGRINLKDLIENRDSDIPPFPVTPSISWFENLRTS